LVFWVFASAAALPRDAYVLDPCDQSPGGMDATVKAGSRGHDQIRDPPLDSVSHFPIAKERQLSAGNPVVRNTSPPLPACTPPVLLVAARGSGIANSRPGFDPWLLQYVVNELGFAVVAGPTCAASFRLGKGPIWPWTMACCGDDCWSRILGAIIVVADVRKSTFDRKHVAVAGRWFLRRVSRAALCPRSRTMANLADRRRRSGRNCGLSSAFLSNTAGRIAQSLRRAEIRR